MCLIMSKYSLNSELNPHLNSLISWRSVSYRNIFHKHSGNLTFRNSKIIVDKENYITYTTF